MKLTAITDICSTMYGPLRPDSIRAIHSFLLAPSVPAWDNCRNLVIDSRDGTGLGVSIWQAWVAIDPQAETYGRPRRFPDPEVLVLGILESRRAVEEGRWRVGLMPAGWLVAEVTQ